MPSPSVCINWPAVPLFARPLRFVGVTDPAPELDLLVHSRSPLLSTPNILPAEPELVVVISETPTASAENSTAVAPEFTFK